MNTTTALIELTRGGWPECQHDGAISVTNTVGTIVAHAGDPRGRIFTRSTLKAFQALPLVHAGSGHRLGLSSSDLALMCGSHNGEATHVTQVESILGKCGCAPAQLQCGCHIPLQFTYTDTPMPSGWVVDARHHNCSGKHAGFLAACVDAGWPTDTYLDAMHPLQVRIRAAVAALSGEDESTLRMGIDGCSAPNYALPLSALARAYARLASRADDAWRGALLPLANAMVTHPELVSGTGRNDLAFMQAGQGDWISKVGADGVQVVASRSRGEALAVKIRDGNKAALFATTIAAMDQLGWLNAGQRLALEPWRGADILSARGAKVGERKPVFQLHAGAPH